MTTQSLRNRVKNLEDSICPGDVPVLVDLGDIKFWVTPNQMGRIIKQVQGTCLKPVALSDDKYFYENHDSG